MAKNVTAASLVFPAGVTVGQALSQGWINLNMVLAGGVTPATGVQVAEGGVDSAQGPGFQSPQQPNEAAKGGGAQVGGNYATFGDNYGNVPIGGTPAATAAACSGNLTLQQALSIGNVQLSNFANSLVFAAIPVQGGD